MIGLAAILWLNVIYVEYQMFYLLLVFLLVPLLSWMMMKASEHGIFVQVEVEQSGLLQTDSAEIGIYVINNSPFAINQGEICVTMKYMNENRREHCRLHADSARSLCDAQEIVITPKHCGIMTIQIEDMTIRDYLQIFSERLEYRGCKKMVIYPELVSKRTGEAEQCENSQNTGMIHSTEVVDIRPYQEGESYRHIHWKLSAGSDTLQCKEYGGWNQQTEYIIVDLSLSDRQDFRAQLDRLYSYVYSIGYIYAVRGICAAYVLWNPHTQNVEYYYFSNRETLDIAMVHVMEQMCSEDAAKHLDVSLQHNRELMQSRPVFVTMLPYIAEDYRIVNILSNELTQVVQDFEMELAG